MVSETESLLLTGREGGVQAVEGRGVEIEEWRGKLSVMRARFRNSLAEDQSVRGLSPEAGMKEVNPSVWSFVAIVWAGME